MSAIALARHGAAAALSVSILLAGCSNQLAPAISQSGADPSGLAPQVTGTLFRDERAGQQGSPASRLMSSARLYVADHDAAVEVLGGRGYRDIGKVSTGVDKPAGAWVDNQGRLYVANYGAKDVTEYARKGGSPICTYSSGLSDPINVTTDATGNVYVVDYNLGAAGSIDVYEQCSNTVTTQYAVAGGPEGAALDSGGDLFVSYNLAGQGAIEEFPAGSNSPVSLSIPVEFAGGIIVDSNQNLLVCDQLQGLVDQIPPPYDAVTLQFTGFASPFNVSLSKSGKRLFLSDTGRKDIVALKYPTGVRIAVLSRKNGIRAPLGVAASPDFTQ